MKETIEVKRAYGGPSQVILGDARQELPRLTAGRRTIVVTDSRVYPLYRDMIDPYEHIVIGRGEENKTLSTVDGIYGELLRLGADRRTCLVGFGGGIVTDITGFAASTYMRGLRFGFVASTLLAQVDASVGGKNGVNYEGYKNMVGTFNQPDFVICDPSLLRTLPEREFRAGLAEIVKCGLICSDELFNLFETRSFGDFYGDPDLLRRVVKESIRIKAEIVERDERESGDRRKLNLGHTFAHAIEKCSREFLHGEAVAIGLCMAAELSAKTGRLSAGEEERVRAAVRGLGLPAEAGVDRRLLFEALKSDKKKEQDTIHFVFMEGIGRSSIANLPFTELEKLL